MTYRQLTKEEIEALRKDARETSERMKAMISRIR